MVESVKITKDGFFEAVIDGKILQVPKDIENRHYRQILEWIDAGNRPQPYVAEREKTLEENIQDRRNSDPILNEVLKRLEILEGK